MIKQKLRDFLATRLASLMRHFALDPRYFDLWQAHGYHVQQVHFYNTLPNTRELPEGTWNSLSELPGLDLNEPIQLSLLEEFSSRYRSEYEALPSTKPPGSPSFYLENLAFGPVESELLYCMVRYHRPQKFIEIGSGFTTLLTAQALSRNRAEGNDCTLTAVEPYPQEFLRNSLPVPVELIVQPVQAVPLKRFTSLREGDILFIDSSHVCKIGSDVQYLFLEILPRLAPGVIIHVHDIFLPKEYPREWVMDLHRFWNEQYLLQAFLCCNRDFEVLWAGSWMHLRQPEKLIAAFPSYDPKKSWSGSFWIRRRPAGV